MPRLIITDTPAKEVGEHISASIQEHTGDIVCLLSGGSALDVVEHIQPGKKCFHDECTPGLCKKTECRTIFMMGDERVSGDAKVNNYLQLKSRYSEHPILEKVLKTEPLENESAKDFSLRIEQDFFSTVTELNNLKILYVVGIGTDGHVAGIFPAEIQQFRKTYQDDLNYVPVPAEGLRIDSRASFTPNWILTNVDELIGYVVGSDKLEILTKLNQEDKKLHERPAELLKQHSRSTVYTDQSVE
jgi:6-phosphogluconolactonase/glucosamine-6-phosphate isomerase/deaminase